MRRLFTLVFGLSLAVVGAIVLAGPAHACGGFFCQANPVQQLAERIVFTVKDDDTVSSLIEIAYAGEAEDFSWILPIPEPIGVDDVAVPDEASTVFNELHRLTDPVFVAPVPSDDCAGGSPQLAMDDTAAMASAVGVMEDVEVFGSGEVGPFGFDIIGAEDPMALTTWLRDNDYQVDPSMEPLIDVYVEEEFSFIAMRLLDGETSDAISPVEITYPGSTPMIPLRLTAVAAFDEMPIFVWIFADHQAVPENFVHFEIATEELTFSPFGANNYTRLVQQRADAVGGRGFITEFAGNAERLRFGDSYLAERVEEKPYLTRLITYIDPEEMLVDPMFGFDEEAGEVSNIRNAREIRGLYDCERQLARTGDFGPSAALDAELINAQLRQGTFAGYDNLDDSVRLNVPETEPVEATDPTTAEPDDETETESATGVVLTEDDGLSTPLVALIAVAATLGIVAFGAGIFGLGRRSADG